VQKRDFFLLLCFQPTGLAPFYAVRTEEPRVFSIMVSLSWGIERTETGMAARSSGGNRQRVIDTRAVAAEFLAMILFVIIGCGVACGHGASDGETRLIVAFAFGMGILVLAYTVGHHSGGQINCAVTFSLVVGGQVPWYQGIANVVAQFIGSLIGAACLAVIFPCEGDMTLSLGTNVVNPVYGEGRACFAEFIMTFLLCFVVWETAVSSRSKAGKNACIAIGFAVFLAHLVLLPIDGCSINPTRSFGPAIVAKIRSCNGYDADEGLAHLWVMFVGPLLGGAAAGLLQWPTLQSIGTVSSTKVLEISSLSRTGE